MNILKTDISGAARRVYEALGPGYSEIIYRRALEIEFGRGVLLHRSEVPIPIRYRGKTVGIGVADLIVELASFVCVIELKAVANDQTEPWSMQLNRYISHLEPGPGIRVVGGLIINFTRKIGEKSPSIIDIDPES